MLSAEGVGIVIHTYTLVIPVITAGKLDGLLESFHEDGQLKLRANYIDGELDGLFEAFDEAGNLTRVEIWGNGELIEGSKLLH